jgi:signal transduction histidine kinase
MTPSDAGDRKRMPGLRTVLIAGLAGMLLVFGVAAIQAVRLLGTMRAENRALRAEALDRSHKLATVRYCIQLSQQYVNEHASAREPVASESDVRDQWTRMMADLTAYRFSGDDDAARLGQLRNQLEAHWAGLNRAMESSATERRLDEEEARPLRISAVQITAQIEDIDARQTAATEVTIQDQFERLGHGLGLALNFALATALLMALGCGIYILRIERQNHRRYEEIAVARRDLEQLSARLVDAQENERRTISRELHDQVGQTLNAVLVDAANLAQRIPADDEIGQRYLNSIRAHADSSVNSIRDISLLLRPSMLDDLGLIPALEWQARETSRRTRIDVRFQRRTSTTRCRMRSAPAFIAWCRRRCRMWRDTRAHRTRRSGCVRREERFRSPLKTMEPDLIRSAHAAWVCWGSKSGCGNWADRWKCSRSRARERRCGCRFRSTCRPVGVKK